MHGQQNDKYTEMRGQQNDKYTETHGQQNGKYTKMHGQQNVKICEIFKLKYCFRKKKKMFRKFSYGTANLPIYTAFTGQC